MNYLYSASTKGFYVSDIHHNIPSDVVEISDEEHGALMEAQASGMIIESNSQGHPIAVKFVMSEEDLAISVRADRDARLAATDWTALTDSPPNPKYQAYRQLLRDVPSQPGFPHDISWPLKPA